MVLATHSHPHHAFFRLFIQTNFDSIPRSLVLSYTLLTFRLNQLTLIINNSTFLALAPPSSPPPLPPSPTAISPRHSTSNKQLQQPTPCKEDSTYTHIHTKTRRLYNTTILPRCLSTGPTPTASTATSRLMEQPTAPNPAGWQSTSNLRLLVPVLPHQPSTDPTTLGPTLPQHPATSSTSHLHTISLLSHHNAGAQ